MNLLKNRQVLLRTATAVGVGVILGWVYWTTLTGLTETWTRDPNYSHGYLVPLLALVILWHCCRGAERLVSQPDPWGLALLLLATVLRLLGAYYYVTPLDHLSLLLALPAICLLLGGRAWLARAWPAFVFLLFMIPIPRTLGGTELIAGLQVVATAASTFCLQTLGLMAYREGNIILLKETELGIVEACSGLRMLMVFCALATATAILLPYGWKRRTLLIASAIPLAIICNVVRITAAGVASQALGSEAGHFVFHDLAGWLMVPLAFALLGAEAWLLSRLFVPVRSETPSLFLSTLPPRRSPAPTPVAAGR